MRTVSLIALAAAIGSLAGTPAALAASDATGMPASVSPHETCTFTYQSVSEPSGMAGSGGSVGGTAVSAPANVTSFVNPSCAPPPPPPPPPGGGGSGGGGGGGTGGGGGGGGGGTLAITNNNSGGGWSGPPLIDWSNITSLPPPSMSGGSSTPPSYTTPSTGGTSRSNPSPTTNQRSNTPPASTPTPTQTASNNRPATTPPRSTPTSTPTAPEQPRTRKGPPPSVFVDVAVQAPSGSRRTPSRPSYGSQPRPGQSTSGAGDRISGSVPGYLKPAGSTARKTTTSRPRTTTSSRASNTRRSTPVSRTPSRPSLFSFNFN